ncbi:MAG: CHAP domain-containing protein [Candidatus Levyibacteriota bacterium]
MDERQQENKGQNRLPAPVKRQILIQGAKAAGTALFNPVILAIVLIIIFTFIIIFALGGGGGIPGGVPGGPSTTPQAPGGGSVASSCTFTRAGAVNSIKSSILIGWINDAANKAGIPASILASVAMHENPNFAKDTTDNNDAIKNNYYCVKGMVFCVIGGERVKHDECLKINKDGYCGRDPCTDEDKANGGVNAQAVGLMQFIDIFNQGVDLCDINQSLALAANKLRADGISSNPTMADVSTAIFKYHNSCTYDGYRYCNEVWDDYQNCKSLVAVNPGAGNILQPATDFVYGLINSITNSCGGTLKISNYGCLDFITPPLLQNVKDQLSASVFNNTYLQCVGFVQAVIAGLTGQPLNKNINAVDYAWNVPTGYQYIDKANGFIASGDIPIWKTTPYNSYGHIAYVTKVYNNDAFEVAEGNWNATFDSEQRQIYGGGVRLKDKNMNDYGLTGWLRKL